MSRRKTELLVDETFKSSYDEDFKSKGKIICMGCKKNMIKTTVNQKYIYLRCVTYAVHPKENLCTSHLVSFVDLTGTVRDKLIYHLKYDFSHICDLYVENSIKSMKENVEFIDKRSAEIKKKLARSYKGLIEGKVAVKQYEFNKKRHSDALKEIELMKYIELMNIKRLQYMESSKEFIDDLQDYYEYNFNDMLKFFVSSIEVGEKYADREKQEIRIHWNF